MATKKVIEKIRSDKAMANGSRQNINTTTKYGNNSNGKVLNGYREIENSNLRKNKYTEVMNEQIVNNGQAYDGVRCPFDTYEIKNRRMYERLFN